MKRISLSLLLFYLVFSLSAIEIEPLRKITLSQTDETFIQKAGSFIVTADENILVFDTKAGHIKIFDLSGKLIKIFGRKGMGPNEFVTPFSSSYKSPYFVFADFGKRSFFIYKTTGTGFEFVKRFLCLGMAQDFHFINDKNLVMAGYKKDKDGKEYNLYEYDFEKDEHDLILPLEVAYGFKSLKRFKNAYKEIAYIGITLRCDFMGNSIYLAWKGDINITKINRKTRATTSFGKKTENYVKPYLTPEIRRAHDRRKHMLLYKLVNRMSYVRDIFVFKSGKIGLVYSGPLKKNNGLNVMLQIYKPNGQFIEELEVLNAKGDYHTDLTYYLSRDKNLFYIMDRETSEEFDQFYKVHEYRIIE